MRVHTCPVCGHEVRHDGETKVEHLPDGRHTWIVSVKVGLGFGGSGAR